MEKKTVEVIVGKAPKGTVDPSKAGQGFATPPKAAEVGGRDTFSYEYVQCPIDSTINYIVVDNDRYLWYQCCNTGCGVHYFEA